MATPIHTHHYQGNEYGRERRMLAFSFAAPAAVPAPEETPAAPRASAQEGPVFPKGIEAPTAEEIEAEEKKRTEQAEQDLAKEQNQLDEEQAHIDDAVRAYVGPQLGDVMYASEEGAENESISPDRPETQPTTPAATPGETSEAETTTEEETQPASPPIGEPGFNGGPEDTVTEAATPGEPSGQETTLTGQPVVLSGQETQPAAPAATPEGTTGPEANPPGGQKNPEGPQDDSTDSKEKSTKSLDLNELKKMTPEQLEQAFKDAIDDFANTEDFPTMALQIIKIVGIMAEYVRRFFPEKGTDKEQLAAGPGTTPDGKPPEGDRVSISSGPQGGPVEGGDKVPKTPEQAAQQRVADKRRGTAEQPGQASLRTSTEAPKAPATAPTSAPEVRDQEAEKITEGPRNGLSYVEIERENTERISQIDTEMQKNTEAVKQIEETDLPEIEKKIADLEAKTEGSTDLTSKDVRELRLLRAERAELQKMAEELKAKNTTLEQDKQDRLEENRHIQKVREVAEKNLQIVDALLKQMLSAMEKLKGKIPDAEKLVAFFGSLTLELTDELNVAVVVKDSELLKATNVIVDGEKALQITLGEEAPITIPLFTTVTDLLNAMPAILRALGDLAEKAEQSKISKIPKVSEAKQSEEPTTEKEPSNTSSTTEEPAKETAERQQEAVQESLRVGGLQYDAREAMHNVEATLIEGEHGDHLVALNTALSEMATMMTAQDTQEFMGELGLLNGGKYVYDTPNHVYCRIAYDEGTRSVVIVKPENAVAATPEAAAPEQPDPKTTEEVAQKTEKPVSETDTFNAVIVKMDAQMRELADGAHFASRGGGHPMDNPSFVQQLAAANEALAKIDIPEGRAKFELRLSRAVPPWEGGKEYSIQYNEAKGALDVYPLRPQDDIDVDAARMEAQSQNPVEVPEQENTPNDPKKPMMERQNSPSPISGGPASDIPSMEQGSMATAEPMRRAERADAGPVIDTPAPSSVERMVQGVNEQDIDRIMREQFQEHMNEVQLQTAKDIYGEYLAQLQNQRIASSSESALGSENRVAVESLAQLVAEARDGMQTKEDAYRKAGFTEQDLAEIARIASENFEKRE